MLHVSHDDTYAGCAHLVAFREENAEAFRRIAAYVASVATKSVLASTLRCAACGDPSGRLHACMECVSFACFGPHLKQHFADKRHGLAIDVQRLVIYCSTCGDYVYDAVCDRALAAAVREASIQPAAGGENGRALVSKRRPYSPWTPSTEDAEHIKSHSKRRRLDEANFGLRGLNNLGNTCFMNCIIQSFIHNPPMRNFFLSDGHIRTNCAFAPETYKNGGTETPASNGGSNGTHTPTSNDERRGCMACEMDSIFRQFYSGDAAPHTPHEFLHTVWRSAPNLAGYEQQDAHEFLIATLDGMHTNCGGKNSDCRCIIHRIFTGALRSDVTCAACGSVSSKEDPFWDVSLDLRSNSQRSADAGLGDSHSGGDECPPNSLVNCLRRFTRPEKLDAREKTFCTPCNSYQESVKQLSMRSLPIVLCCHLKRFEHSKKSVKIGTLIDFPSRLDLTPYTTEYIVANRTGHPSSAPPLGSNMYSLFAVVNHQGSMDTGHYTCFVRRGEQWYKCDDAWVTKVSPRDVLASEGYLLFYVRESLEYEDSTQKH